ncbi:MAG: hypothetical protein U0V74_04805 [Chitinophagales bacterium]
MADGLFELIKTLDKSEKGYFKKFSSRYGEKSSGNDYLKLFDVLDKQEEYDEEKVKKAFAKSDKKFNLSAQKAYLYGQIIRALRSYASGKTPSYLLREQIQDINNLIDRGLTEQALDMIADSIKRATAIENHELLLQLKYLEESQIVRNLGRFTMEDAKRVKLEIQELLAVMARDMQIGMWLFEMKLLDDERGKQEVVSKDLVEKAHRIAENPVLKDVEQFGKRGKIQTYALLHIYYAIIGNDKESLNYLKLTHEVYKNMDLDLRATYSYLANLSNIIMTALNAGEIKEAEHYLNVIGKTRFKDVALENYRVKIYGKNLLMVSLVSTLTTVPGKEIFEVEKSYLSGSPEMLGNNNTMSAYYLAVLFFAANEIEKAEEWFIKTTEHKNTTFINVQAYCRVIRALIHYEQGNLSLMDSALQNAQYFMKKSNINSPYLRACISMLGKLPTAVDASGQREQLKKMQQSIEDMYKTELSEEITYFHDFNLAVWCRSKLNGLTYGQQLVEWQLEKTGNAVNS